MLLVDFLFFFHSIVIIFALASSFEENQVFVNMILNTKAVAGWFTSLLLLTALVQPINIYAAKAQRAEAQSSIDSVLKAFEQASAAQQKQLADSFFYLLNGEDFFDEPYTLPQEWPIDSIRAEVYYNAGQYYFYSQEYAKGVTYNSKALPFLSKGKDKDKFAECLSTLSSCYFRVSDFANAIRYAEKVLNLDKEIGDQSTVSADLNNIAVIYLASKRPEEALSYTLEAIKHSTAAGDSLSMAIQRGTASEIYSHLDDYPKALEYATEAYGIDKRCGRTGKAAIRLCQMAAPLMKMERYKEAGEHLLRALPVLEETGNRQSYSIACNQLGQIALYQNKRQQAVEYFNKALPFLVERGDYYNEITSRKGLYQALKASEPQQAMQHLVRFCALKDSVYNRQMQQSIGEHNAKYKNEELQLKYEYENKLKRTFVWVSIPVILLAVGIIILLLLINRQRRQKHRILKQAEQMRTTFFTNITHEFRTPLTIIQSAAQDIMSRVPQDSELHQNAADILHHGQGLLSLINQILDIARMSSSGMQASGWKHGDIIAFMGMLCESHKAYAASQNIDLVYEPQQEHLLMDFNPDYIQKALQNLISNAIKFSKPNSKVLVTAQAKGSCLHIVVRDTGIGMTEQQQAHIFEPFYQIPGSTRSIGTGIGLAVVKLAVESMNGRIEVHSAPEKGSVFTLRIPMKQEGIDAEPLNESLYAGTDAANNSLPQTVALPEDNAAGSDTVRVLVVEDTPEVARYMARQLNPKYSYYFASNGEEGFEKAEQLVPDIIITDIMMPVMNGLEMCRRIRASELLNHIPVIMVTAKATHQDRLLGLEAGADAYLEKPFHADELEVRVEKLLEQRRLLRQKYAQVIEQVIEEKFEPSKAAISDANQAFLAKVTDAVQKVMDGGNIDYDQLSSNLCLSRSQLNRKIKAITGNTTTDFILQIKITRAKHLLDTTDMPIWEIALQCGMDNDSYFCTLFKKVTGQTPLQYKNRKA